MTPTSAGRTLIDGAAQVLAAIADFQRLADDVAGSGAPEVRIGLYATAAGRLLPTALAELRRTHPQAVLHVTETEPVHGLRGLRTGEIDLLLRRRTRRVRLPGPGPLRVLRQSRDTERGPLAQAAQPDDPRAAVLVRRGAGSRPHFLDRAAGRGPAGARRGHRGGHRSPGPRSRRASDRAGQWKTGDLDILLVLDASYDSQRLSFLLDDLPLQVLGRLRSDRVMRRPTPPRVYDPQGGRPPKHGGEFVCGQPDTWGEPDAQTATETHRYGTAVATAFDRPPPETAPAGRMAQPCRRATDYRGDRDPAEGRPASRRR